MASNVNRRNLIKQVLSGSAALAAGVALPKSVLASVNEPTTLQDFPSALSLKGNINHSVCRWCYSDMKLEDLCKVVKEIGFGAIDLLKPNEWPIAKQLSLIHI